MIRKPKHFSLCHPLFTRNPLPDLQPTTHSIHRKIASAVFVTLALCCGSLAQTGAGGDKTLGAKDSGTARGEYIVNNVAVCSQCHTPRDGQGHAERSHWLEGASLWLQPADPSGNWPQYAPRLAGALPGTEEEMVTLLTTGIWRTGTYLRPPMPQYRMSRQDAEAVVAYLKVVKPMMK